MPTEEKWILNRQSLIIELSNAGAQAIVEPKQLGFIPRKMSKKDYEKMKSGVMERSAPSFQTRIPESN